MVKKIRKYGEEKISKYLKKSLFFSQNKLGKDIILKKKKKKYYPLSFPILGGRDLTTVQQSSPFQNPGGVV